MSFRRGSIAANRRRSSVPSEFTVWDGRMTSVSASREANTDATVLDFLTRLNLKSYRSNVRLFYGMGGSGHAAFRCPWIDDIGAGIATNQLQLDANCTQARGMQGDGSNQRHLFANFQMSQLDPLGGMNGGIGWIETGYCQSSNGAVEPVGIYNHGNSMRFCLDFRGASQAFHWGNPANGVSAGVRASSTGGHYYGQRSSATSRKIYIDGVLRNTNTNNDTAVYSAWPSLGVTIGCINVSGNVTYPWPGRGALCYFTDGGMSDADVADFHSLIVTYLLTPFGRALGPLSDYKQRVADVGDGNLSSTAESALSAFIASCISDGLWERTSHLNMAIGPSFNASLVNIKNNGWAVDWKLVNTNYVSGDYSEATGWNGASGGGRLLNTKCKPAQTYYDANNASIFAYDRTTMGSGIGTLGAHDSGSARSYLYIHYSDSKCYSNMHDVATEIASAAQSGGVGFIHNSRNASNRHALFRNGSQIASSSSPGGSLAATAELTLSSPHVIAGIGAGLGFDATQMANFYTHWQTFQTALSRNV